MAEQLIISNGDKETKYKTLLPQIVSLIENEPDLIANLANVSAAIYDTFHHLWVGFYLVKPAVSAITHSDECPASELVLGPFQGPIACTRIRRGRGVCGAAWQKAVTLVVPDVNLFAGHIACSSRSRSEIVVPLKDAAGRVWGVLDVDSDVPDTFDAVDVRYLEALCGMLTF